MTDEERQRLCERLRSIAIDNWWADACDDAADEIERLDKAWKEWRSIAERLQDDLRTGKRTCDFSFLGEAWVNIDNTTVALAQSDAEPVAINDAREQALSEAYVKGFEDGRAQSDAEPEVRKKLEEVTAYAEQLAVSLAARWYPEVPQWKPLSGDLIGLLTQIDNMTTGAVRAQSNAEPRPDASAGLSKEIDRARDRISVVVDTLEAGGEPINWERNCITFLHEALEALSFRARAAPPPRPDASAGLIEAAEWHEAQRQKTMIPQKIMVHRVAADYFRAIAADRSGK